MAVKNEAGGIPRERSRTSDLLTFLPSYLPFFVLSFLYLWLIVEPHLIYHGFGTLLPNAPQFATGWSFLQDALRSAGGPVTYASAFLSQGYVYSWLGALVIVLAGFCLSELFRRHLVKAGLLRASVLAPLPAIMLFLVYSQYHHPLTNGLAVALGLLLSLIFEQRALRRPWARVVACGLAAAVALWLGGAGTLLVFALMTLIHRVFRRDWMTAGAILPLSLAVAWVLARYVFLIPLRETLLTLTPFAPSATSGLDPFLRALVFLLYGFVPLAVLLASVGRGLFGMRRQQAGARRKKDRAKSGRVRTTHRSAGAKKDGAWYAPYVAKAALAALPVALMALGLYASHKSLRKPYVLSNYHARQRNWQAIIDLNYRLPKTLANPFVSHDFLHALYHTGRLPYDMFRRPLVPEAILLTHEKQESDLTQWKLSDIFLELGHVNMAQKLASELLATKGHLGVALEELGWISIVKGHPDTARVYLNALRRDPVYRRRAESLLHGLDSGFAPEQAAHIDALRSCMQDEAAGVTGTEPVDETLAALLARNPHNKMAFEYLMACYLLTGRVDKIVANMDRLRDLGYSKIPTLYEEAILIHFGTQRRDVDLTRFPISQETLQRYETFVPIHNAMQSPNHQLALTRLIREFGTSYFFYYSFGKVGLG